jgi:hypothetical protein
MPPSTAPLVHGPEASPSPERQSFVPLTAPGERLTLVPPPGEGREAADTARLGAETAATTLSSTLAVFTVAGLAIYLAMRAWAASQASGQLEQLQRGLDLVLGR